MDIVARPQHQRLVDLRDRRLGLRDRLLKRRPRPLRRRAHLNQPPLRLRQPPQPRIVQPHLPHRLNVDVHAKQLLLKQLRAAEQLPARPEDRAAPVENQMILPPHQIAVRRRHRVVRRPRRQHLLPLRRLPRVKRRAVDVHDQLRPRQTLILHRPRRVPNVLADRHPYLRPRNLEQLHPAARPKVARLVEDPVVGQVLLVVHPVQPPVAQHRRRVEHIARVVHEAHNRRRMPPARRLPHPIQRAQIVLHKPPPQHQILRRVARQRQLRKRHNIRADRFRRLDLGDNPGRVALQIAHRRVDLRQRAPQIPHSHAPSPTTQTTAPQIRHTRAKKDPSYPRSPRVSRRAQHPTLSLSHAEIMLCRP